MCVGYVHVDYGSFFTNFAWKHIPFFFPEGDMILLFGLPPSKRTRSALTYEGFPEAFTQIVPMTLPEEILYAVRQLLI